MKKTKLFFALFLLFILIPNAIAQGFLEQPVNFSGFARFVKELFRFTSPTTSWGELLVVLCVFAIFLFAFQDIIYGFTAFSKTTSWVIAFALAIIGAITKGTLIVARFLMTLTVWAGAFSVFFALIMGFAVFAILHFIMLKFAIRLRHAKTQEEIKTNIEFTKAGISGLKQIGKELKGTS